MPLTHTRSFRVRFCECDAYGHLNNAHYLRYMQETAFDASAEIGYDKAFYEQLGRTWLTRETEIEYLQPLFYNDTVLVKTWVSDFRRATSRREYEFTHATSGALVARGATRWVYVDTATLQPAAVPQEIARGYLPEGLPAATQPRQHFPAAPPPPAGVFQTRRKVRWHDIDSLQHVNNAVYLEYVEECGMQVLAAHGWPAQRMDAEGVAILMRKNHIRYRQPALLDEELEILTWAAEVRRSTAVRYYHIRRPGVEAPLVEVHALGVWVDLKNGRPARWPERFMQDFKENIVWTPAARHPGW